MCTTVQQDNCFGVETGNNGTRLCRESVKNAKLAILGYNVEYRRARVNLNSLVGVLSSRQQAFRNKRLALLDARRLIKKHTSQVEDVQHRRETLLKMLEDPQETLAAQGQQYFDTDVIHGTPQRVRPAQLFDMVEPLINHSSTQLNYALNADRMVYRLLMHVCGAEISRIGHGFLWRVRIAEFRKLYLQNVAAIAIQSLWRGLFVRKYIVPLFKAQRSTRCAIVIQRITRGWLKRLWFTRVMQHRRQLLEAAAAVRIQATVRGWTIYKDRDDIWEDANDERAQWDEYRQIRLERARQRRWKAENTAACNIQRMVRGLLARREAYMRRQQGFISHPRVRELADAYLSGGDLWGLLATINMDYERRDTGVRNDQVQMDAFIKQMQRLREEKADFDPAAWEEAKQQLGIDNLQPTAQTMDAKLAIMEQLYLPGQARGIPDSRAGTRFVVQKDSNRYLQSTGQERMSAAQTQAAHIRPRDGDRKRQPQISHVARGPEDPGNFTVKSSAAVLQQHRFTAYRQPLHQPIDGTHPMDEYLPEQLTATLATKPNALGETPEEVRSKMESQGPKKEPAVQHNERGFTAYSVQMPEMAGPKSVQEAAYLGASSLAQLHDSTREAGHQAVAPFFSGKTTTWNRPLIPGGSLVGKDGYFRPKVMSAALSQIDRLASKVMIQAATENDGRPVSPATMLLLRVKSKKQAADRETFKMQNRQLFKDESKHLEGPDQTYEDQDGNRMAMTSGDLVIHDDDTPRSVVAKKLKALAMESAMKSTAAGAKEARDAAQQSPTKPLSAAEVPTKTYRQVKYEAILHTARTAAAGLVSAIAETIESMIIRERIDERTAEAIASGTTAAGAGPEGFSRLAASGVMNTVSLGALSRATSRATTPAHGSRPPSRAIGSTAYLTGQAATSTKTTRSSRGAPPTASEGGMKPHIQREGSIAAKTFSEIKKMGYHVLHGRSEISNPAGVQVQAQLEDAERVADARRKAKANVRKERYYSALANQHEGGQRLANLFGVGTGSVAETDAVVDEQFNDEPLVVHGGVRLGDGVEEAIRKEQLVQAYTSGGMPNVHSLLRDVRGMKGPLDALIVHAVLRSIPVPKGVIKWAQRAQISLSTEIVQLSREGKALLVDPATEASSVVSDTAKAHIAAASEMQSPKIGEEAAKIFADMPAGMVKVQWERIIREKAAPIVAVLARNGCETAGDVQNIDISKLQIDHSICATIRRLLHILRVSQKLSSAGVVREVFASAPTPIQPPLMGPYSALNNQNSTATKHGGNFLQKPGAGGEFDVNESSSRTYGKLPSYDPPGGSRLLGLNLDRIADQDHKSPGKSLASNSMFSSVITPRAAPARNAAPAVVMGSAQGGVVSGRTSKQRQPIAVVHAIDQPTHHNALKQGAVLSRTQPHDVGQRQGVSGRLHAAVADSTNQETAVAAEDANFFVQAGLYTGFGAGYADAGRCVGQSEVSRMLKTASSQLQSSAISESELLRTMHEQQAREKSSHMAKVFKQPIESGIETRGEAFAQTHIDQEVERMRLPHGCTILERDEALSAPILRKTMEKREQIVDFQAEVQELMGSKLGKGLAYTRRKQEIDAQQRAEELQQARKDSEETLQQAKRTAFQIYYEDKLGGGELPASSLSSVQHDIEARKVAESSISELLSSMETQLNGLSYITDLDSSIDPALIQVAFTLPIPCPRLVSMADHRTQQSRTESERLQTLVPYNLFLRQLIAYHLPAQNSKKMDDTTGTKKQRMLIKERTRSASIIARYWVAALQRWGYDRIGQLVNVPRKELVRVLSCTYPIKRSPGMSRLEKVCSDVCGSLLPADISTSLESVLRHWQHMSPSTFKTVRQSWSSFDRRFQRGPTDINGRPEVGRKLAAERRQARQLKSANWATFSKAFDSSSSTKSADHMRVTLPSIQQVDSPLFQAHDQVKPLLSPLWFAGGSLNSKHTGFHKGPSTTSGDGTASFLLDFVADDAPEARKARKINASAGGMTLPREQFISGAPKIPSPIDSTVKYVKNSRFSQTERDCLGLTAAGAVPMEWQHALQDQQ